jgi:general secretion pathway protein E
VRLVDLGIEPWIVANALSAVIAQRLVRVVCSMCQATVKLESDVWDEDDLLLPAGTDVVRPRGCNACYRTGYRGRAGIFETLVVDDDLRDLVKAKGSASTARGERAARCRRSAGWGSTR